MLPSLKRRRDLRLFMTADAVGGVWRYALDLARTLGPQGVTTTLAVLGPPPAADQAREARAVAGLRLLRTGLPLDWMAPSGETIGAAGAALAALAHQDKPDLVHLNSPALAAASAFPAPVVAVAHSCVATWWEAVRSGPLPPDFAWRTDLTAHGYRAADALVAPSRAFAEATARAYDLPVAPQVVHNGRRLVAPRDSVRPAAPPSFAFTAGRLWDEGKNLAALDRAAARLAIPVLAAGPTEGPNGAGIGLGHVRALGRLGEGDIARWLAAGPVFVSTARYEPFGLAVLEAAQAGCPLVLADIPTFRELWAGAAEFVPPDDAIAIAAAIDRVSRDARHRAHLGEAARERSRDYTVERMAEGLLGIYDHLMSRDPASSSREAAA